MLFNFNKKIHNLLNKLYITTKELLVKKLCTVEHEKN